MKKIKWVDILKGYAIVMVVIGHIIKNDFLVNYLYAIHLPIFMFISGYLYKKDKNIENFKKKFKSILIPYLFFSLINLLYFFIIESKFRSISISLLECIKGIILGHYDYLSFNVHLWYLPFFFFVSLLFNFFSNIIGEKRTAIFFITLGLIYPFISFNNLPFSINRLDLMMFFGIGVIASKYKMTQEKNNKTPIFILIANISILTSLVLVKMIKIVYIDYIIGILGILSFLLLSIITSNYDKIMHKLGGITLTILCIHGPIYRVLLKVISVIINKDTEIIRSNLLLVLVVTSITIIICTIVNYMLKSIYPPLVGAKQGRKKVES